MPLASFPVRFPADRRQPDHCSVHLCRRQAVLCPLVGLHRDRQLCESHGFLHLVEHPSIWTDREAVRFGV